MTDEEDYEARTADYKAKKKAARPLIEADIEAAIQAVLQKIVVDHSTLIERLEVSAADPKWDRDTETSAAAVWKTVKIKKLEPKEPPK